MHSKLSDQAMGPAADQRSRLLDQVKVLEYQAMRAAENGDLADAAQKILASLDCERRAGSIGPQVLQLIKPRT